MHGDMDMSMSMPLLPPWLRIAWTITMCGVAVLHAWHAVAFARQVRWWHCGHTAMAAGMAVMYASGAALDPRLRNAGLALFALATVLAAIAAPLMRRREGAVDPLWVVAAADLLAMTYMLLPTEWRPVVVSYLLVGYLVCQLAARAFGLWSRPAAVLAVAPSREDTSAVLAVGAGDGGRPLDGPTAVAVGGPAPGRAEVGLVPHYTPTVRATLAVMAAGMAYMLFAMS